MVSRFPPCVARGNPRIAELEQAVRGLSAPTPTADAFSDAVRHAKRPSGFEAKGGEPPRAERERVPAAEPQDAWYEVVYTCVVRRDMDMASPKVRRGAAPTRARPCRSARNSTFQNVFVRTVAFERAAAPAQDWRLPRCVRACAARGH